MALSSPLSFESPHNDDLLAVETSVRDDVVIVAARGELDLSTVPALRQALLESLVQTHARVIVDLDAVTYMDSTALGLLVGFRRRTQTDGFSMTIVCNDPACRRLFEMTGLDSVFSFAASVEAALATGTSITDTATRDHEAATG